MSGRKRFGVSEIAGWFLPSSKFLHEFEPRTRTLSEASVFYNGKGDGEYVSVTPSELSRRDGVAQWRHEGNQHSLTLLDREPNE